MGCCGTWAQALTTTYNSRHKLRDLFEDPRARAHTSTPMGRMGSLMSKSFPPWKSLADLCTSGYLVFLVQGLYIRAGLYACTIVQEDIAILPFSDH